MERFSKLHLFENFVEQFLVRLPPKSLMRFKCVCTLWCDLINSPSFVAKHLSNSLGASSVPLLFKRPVLKDKNNKIVNEREKCLNDDDNVETLLSSLNFYNDHDDDFLLSTVVEDLNVPLPAPLKLKHSSDLIIAGHCDGIICLKLFIGNVILWNPAMKEFKLLPKSFLLLPKDDDEYRPLEYWIRPYSEYLGFGYDPKRKDYKVVRIVIYDEECYGFNAEVYTINSNSWRVIKTKYDLMPGDDIMASDVLPSSYMSVYLNGICYWMQYCGFILSFDMGNELFNEIPYPDLLDGCSVITLAIWKNFISLLTYQEKLQSYDMWVMVDDISDGRGPWRKQLTVEYDGCPLLFCNSLKLLFVNNNDGQLTLYDIGTHVLNYLPIHFMGYMKFAQVYKNNQAIVYTNSIVSINGGNVLDNICISAFYGSGKFQSSYRGEVDISAFQ